MGVQLLKPGISILIAIRNEADNLPALLESLSHLDYHDYEILFGNDGSTDGSSKILVNFCNKYPNAHYFDIPLDRTIPGKSGVLSILAKRASKPYMAFTDGDMILPHTWLTALVDNLDTSDGVVCGLTQVEHSSYFEKMQALEWITAFLIFYWLSKFRFPTTASGNNMLVKTEAYFAAGGYESMPFTLTEDYQLYHEIIRKGYNVKHLFCLNVLATTKPPLKFWAQRDRWTQGLFSSKKTFHSIPTLLWGVFLPFLILLFTCQPFWASAIYFTYLFHLMVVYISVENDLKAPFFIWDYLAFSIYAPTIATVTLIRRLARKPINWKGRIYTTQ